jgi:hypothetical protein
MRQPVELAVDHWDELVEGRPIAVAPGDQKPRDVRWRGCWHGTFP